MKRILFFFALLLSVALGSHAQTLQKADVMSLVTANADAIGIKKDQVSKLKLSSTYADAGTQYVYLLQTYQGLPVYNQMLVLAFKNNQLISHAGVADPSYGLEKSDVSSSSPSLTASDAVAKAFSIAQVPSRATQALSSTDNGSVLNFGKLPGVTENVTAELMWVPTERPTKGLKLAWQVQVVPQKKSDWWLIQIDANTGTLLNKYNLTVEENDRKVTGAGILRRPIEKSIQATEMGQGFNPPPPTVTTGSYRVVPFPYESPAHHAFAVVNDPWLLSGINNNATTNGWHFDGTTNYNITRGNNVNAYMDVDGTNAPNTGNNFLDTSTTAIPALTFNFVQDPTVDPNTNGNKKAAITSLFYWNNLMHDMTYQYGFTEAAGNFQTDNIARGGVGNDAVQAEAQDASGTNNANFNTPVDGQKPRMQMFLFDAATTVTLKVNTPASIAGNYTATEGAFNPAIKLSAVGPITAQAVLFNDATGGTHDACSGPPSNSLTGKIALLYRNVCAFAIKVKEAQTAGAKAVIVINNTAGAPLANWGAADNTILIPAVMVSDVDGAKLVSQIANNENITLSATSGQRLDGDLDAGVMCHEYGHGVSTRLSGGPATPNCLNNLEEGGEGWSDFGALMMTTDWTTATVNDGPKARPMGIYVEGQLPTGAGIRTYPYSTDMAINPWTYSGVQSSGGEVHTIGEIWCATIWDMTWGIIKQQNSINTNLFAFDLASTTGGNSIALKLVYEGMKLQPCSPGFLDARNAIIQADINLYGGKHLCTIWTAFARRGMGYSAVQGSANNTNDQVQAFDLPPAVVFTTQPASIAVCTGSTATFTATVAPGASTTYQWQILVGSTWVNISGATTLSYTTAATTAANNGTQYRLVGTTACGTTISNVATLSVIAATVGGTLAPSSASVCGVAYTTGKLTLTGQAGNITQWESSIDGGTTWVPFADTTNTYNYNVSQTTQYRVLIQGIGCAAPSYSSIATVTVSVTPIMSIVPDPGATLCAGDPTKLSVMEGASSVVVSPKTLTTVGAAGLTFNFSNTNAYPVTVTDVLSYCNNAGSTDVTLYFKPSAINGAPGAITSLNGWNQFGNATIIAQPGVQQQFVSGLNLVIPANTTYGILVTAVNTAPPVNGITVAGPNLWYSNVITPATVTTAGCSIIVGTNVGYTTTSAPPVTATTNGARYAFVGSVRFKSANTQVTTGTFAWTPAAGLNNTTGNPVAASPMTSTTYTVTNNDGAGCIRTASINITVNARPAITTQPLATIACAGSSAVFSIAATGTNLTYQWQVSTDNCTTYANIAGATTTSLSLATVTAAMNGNGYRCVVSGSCTPAVNSNCVKLTVNTLPVVSITPSGPVCGGVPGISGTALNTGGPASPPPIPGTATFTSGTINVAIPEGALPNPPATAGVTTIPVTGIPSNATIKKISVKTNITHNYVGDVIMVLKSPSGAIINLDAMLGATNNAGSNFVNTVISSDDTKPGLSGATQPFTGEFKADKVGATFAAFGFTFAGGPVGYTPNTTTWSPFLGLAGTTGTWSLAAYDAGPPDVGNFTSWSITFDYTTPDPAGAPITYTWSPAAGLYNDTKATDPYVNGAQTPIVYAAPTTLTTYTVTATTTATGCANAASVVVNATPAAPIVIPNPATICNTPAYPAIKLKSAGVLSTPAIWSPATGLYSDAAASIAYVPGTAVDSVYAKPTATTTYNVTVNTGASAASTISMANTLATYYHVLTFNVRNNNLYAVKLTEIATGILLAGNTNVTAWYKATAINGLPGAISTANGWTLLGSATITAPGTYAVQPLLTGLNLSIPGNQTYGIAITSDQVNGGIVFSATATPISSGGGVDLISGANVTYVTDNLPPGAPNVAGGYYFVGSIKVTADVAPCTSPATAVVVNVNTPAAITTQPTAATVCTDKVTSFTAAATGTAIIHNWRVSTNGVNWTDVADGGVYSGSKTGTLVITAPPVSMSGYLYKDSVSTTPCAAAVSNTVKLTVNPLPTINLSVAPFRKLFPGLTTTITASVTPPAATYTWLRNGVPVTNATTNSIVVNVNGLGDYSLSVTDVNGCNSTSGIVSITDSASGRFFIYPNPNNGLFQVRYYSIAGSTNLVRGINVYDARGKRVLTQGYSISTPFARMDVDLRNYGSGVYWLELVDVAGNRLATGRAEVLR